MTSIAVALVAVAVAVAVPFAVAVAVAIAVAIVVVAVDMAMHQRCHQQDQRMKQKDGEKMRTHGCTSSSASHFSIADALYLHLTPCTFTPLPHCFLILSVTPLKGWSISKKA